MENWDFCDWVPEITEKCISESYKKKIEEQKLVEEADYQLTNELFNGSNNMKENTARKNDMKENAVRKKSNKK
jgi:hypothetical protein